MLPSLLFIPEKSSMCQGDTCLLQERQLSRKLQVTQMQKEKSDTVSLQRHCFNNRRKHLLQKPSPRGNTRTQRSSQQAQGLALVPVYLLLFRSNQRQAMQTEVKRAGKGNKLSRKVMRARAPCAHLTSV